MTQDNSPITFVVAGKPRDATRGGGSTLTEPPIGGRVKASVLIAARRGDTPERIVAVPGQDVVVLHIANGPELYLHPQIARDLLLAQSDPAGATRSRGAVGSETEVEVPAQLSWPAPEQDAVARSAARGPLGDLLLSAVDVVTGLFKDSPEKFVASEVVKHVDGQVVEGVYELDPTSLTPLKGSDRLREKILPAPNGEAHLVLIHGTFVDTVSTFDKLWSLHRGRVSQLFDRYEGRVYALDHPTLGASPIQNALALAKAFPEGGRLHLLTHSRGGLVAEVLARVCGNPTLSAADLDLFAGDAYKDERSALEELVALVRVSKLKVDRLMRVACPARGTLLASTRLDAYISVLKWTLELSGVPIAPSLVQFLGQVALQRTNPEVLPGLAAMMPNSPLVQWLHATDEPIAGELRVVSGDVRANSLGGWLKILISDWFYWTDNDLIVQTRSMYGGAPRAAGARFLLAAGGEVSHFSYFKNESSAQAIVEGLVQDSPKSFRPIGPLSWAGEDASGVRAARRVREDATRLSEKPAVIVLPGILGSNLKVDDKRVWLSLRIVGGLSRLKYQVGDRVAPDGPIGSIYDDLIDYLADTHEVIPFAYDWRRPLEEEARKLGDVIDAALSARSLNQQPVRIVAHSMGGLLARTLWLERSSTWERMMSRGGARLLMLGTPNDGSWAPMQVLSGDDNFGNLLSSFGLPFREHEARKLMAAMPGFLQLQAGLADASLGLEKAATWQKLADDDLDYFRARTRWHALEIQLEAQRWGVPAQPVLDLALGLRKRLDAQREELAKFADKILLVVGRSKRTPAGFSVATNGFEYLDEQDTGDGRVPLASARLPGVRTWTLDCVHGDLPRVRHAFDAFRELLERGDTQGLETLRVLGSTRGGAATVEGPLLRSRAARARLRQPVLPPQQPSDVFDPLAEPLPAAEEAQTPPLRVTVLNGDLTLVPEPLVVGHYRSFAVTGAEFVVDKLIGGMMSRSLQIDQYPDLPGSHQIFANLTTDPDNPWRAPCPEAVIVVGLGEETMLTPPDLARSVRNGVIAWSQRQLEHAPDTAPAHMRLAATLIGSGGSGITAGMSARAVAQGVHEANRQLAAIHWPVVSNLVLAELFHDRASAAWQELTLLASSSAGQFEIDPLIKIGTGPLPRPLEADYRGIDNDLITVSTSGTGVNAAISYTLDTRRARSEVTALKTQTNLIKTLVSTASNDLNQDQRIGRTLFQLLVPEQLEPFLNSRSRMVLELDPGTGGIPWELLDVRRDRASDDEPWAIRSQLLRKLRTTHYRRNVSDARVDDHILIIGEPRCEPGLYPRLPNAAEEAREVESRLRGDSRVSDLEGRIHALFDADARTIMNELFERRYRVVHIAGHGEAGAAAGVVLSDDIFLGPNEISAMRTVPELVFVNCCYLAKGDDRALLKPYDRADFAAGVADALIKIGVRCVIAAGWAVDDAAAREFATTFYRELLADRPFIEAVNEARRAAWAIERERGGNTWAAYQCYGDPDWTFRLSDRSRPSTRSFPDEYSRIASARALLLALETLAVQTSYQRRDRSGQLERVRYLDARFGAQWGAAGNVAEAFAVAYAAIGGDAFSAAIEWYTKALADEDGRASQHAEEQLHNLIVRNAEWRVRGLRRGSDEAKLKQALNRSFADLQRAARSLEKLAAARLTQERASLCGSAFKRIAMLASDEREEQTMRDACEKMREWYQRARDLARSRGSGSAYYPAMNCLAIDLIENAGDAGWQGFDRAEVERTRQSLVSAIGTSPDFWCKVSAIELQLYESLALPRPEIQLDPIISQFEDLHRRVAGAAFWSSVYDQTRFILVALDAVLPQADARLVALEKLCGLLAEYAGAEPWLGRVSLPPPPGHQQEPKSAE